MKRAPRPRVVSIEAAKRKKEVVHPSLDAEFTLAFFRLINQHGRTDTSPGVFEAYGVVDFISRVFSQKTIGPHELRTLQRLSDVRFPQLAGERPGPKEDKTLQALLVIDHWAPRVIASTGFEDVSADMVANYHVGIFLADLANALAAPHELFPDTVIPSVRALMERWSAKKKTRRLTSTAILAHLCVSFELLGHTRRSKFETVRSALKEAAQRARAKRSKGTGDVP